MGSSRPPLLAEHLLILHGRLSQLLAQEEWEEAALLGERALHLSSSLDPIDSDGCAALAFVCAAVAKLGMAASGVRLRDAVARVVATERDAVAMRSALDALHTLVRGQREEFFASVPAEQLCLAFFEAVPLDEESAPAVFRHPRLAVVVQSGLGSADQAVRARVLALLGKLLLLSPLKLSPALVPLLSKAVLHEDLPLQSLCLAALADATFLLASSPAPPPPSSPLPSLLELMYTFLYAPAPSLQQLALLGLAKLALHPQCAEPGSALAAEVDVEGVVAELAYRYTEEAAAEDEARLMPTFCLLFESLAAARLTLLSNSVIWICLGAAEDCVASGVELSPTSLRANGRMQAHTQSWRVSGGHVAWGWLEPGMGTECVVASSCVHRVLCLRFLLSLLPTGASGEVVSAVRLNLHAEHRVALDDGCVAKWIGVDA
ncbi:hypothetical protein AB1Y20_007806 [Prymnesium parvum]|uniref:Uncharacterized protein n=1 Tax=Prymnesium parvum TaxID=97485 RepID=A0AB34ISZ1_PRYPA